MIDWQLIIEEHGPAVWRTAYRLLGNHADAADCFQETFVCALEFSRRQRVRDFSALLARLATTRAIDRLRRRSRRPDANPDPAELATVASANPSPLQQVQHRELAASLRRSLAQLPAQEAQVFCLRYLSDMSYRQIGKELGLGTAAAGVLLHRARAKLRGSLQLVDE